MLAAVALVVAFGAAQGTPSAAAPEGIGPPVMATEGIPPLVRSAATLADGRTTSAGPTEQPAARPPARERPRRSRRPAGTRLASVRSGQSLPLRARPGGSAVTRVGARTEFGSESVLSVVEERDGWLGVTTAERPNGRLGWVRRRSDALKLDTTDYSITVDLSRRKTELLRGDRVVRRLPVAIGRPESPTPTGRFAITDKLDGPDYSPYFGCCILALSGKQPKLPAGWPGGDRLAIHGTNSPDTIGTAASAGCLRAEDGDVRALMSRVPLGTPVRIQK